jgi:hypothetical protein
MQSCIAPLLRLLAPDDLTRAAGVCRDWRDAARELASRDVAHGTEAALLLAPSAAEAAELGSTFLYVPAAELGDDSEGSYGGCLHCEPDSLHARWDLECGPACACSCLPAACPRRQTQARVAVPLSLARTVAGWGVFADMPVAAGTFVCTYSGEMLTADGARLRLASQDAGGSHDNFIMLCRETLPSGDELVSAIDPRMHGNVGRFINHACDGGCLELRLVS